MMTASDEVDSIAVNPNDNELSKSPNYNDLLEENKYLRGELSRFYEQIAQPDKANDKCDCALRIKALEDSMLAAGLFHDQLIAKIESLRNELGHIQAHSIEQAALAKSLENRLLDTEADLHVANAELLQILPLRMKLTEANKKLEAIRADFFATSNQINSLNQEKAQLQKDLEKSWLNFEDMQLSFNNLWEQCQAVKVEKIGDQKADYSFHALLISDNISECHHRRIIY